MSVPGANGIGAMAAEDHLMLPNHRNTRTFASRNEITEFWAAQGQEQKIPKFIGTSQEGYVFAEPMKQAIGDLIPQDQHRIILYRAIEPAKQKLGRFMSTFSPAAVFGGSEVLRRRWQFKGFDADFMLQRMIDIEPDWEVLIDDVWNLCTLFFLRGTKVSKIEKTLGADEAAMLNLLKVKYDLKDNAGQSRENVTLSRIAMVFAPFSVVIGSDPEIPLITDLNVRQPAIDADAALGIEARDAREIEFPKGCRSTAVLSLLDDQFSNNFKKAVTACVLYHQCYLGQIVKKNKKKVSRWPSIAGNNLRYLKAVKPTIWQLSHAERRVILVGAGCDDTQMDNLIFFQERLNEKIQADEIVNIDRGLDLDTGDILVED